jgi:hypothetical protein
MPYKGVPSVPTPSDLHIRNVLATDPTLDHQLGERRALIADSRSGLGVASPMKDERTMRAMGAPGMLTACRVEFV